MTTLPITETEYATLIHESTRDKVVSAEFGTFGVRLTPIPTNRWALQRVAELRGIDLNPKPTA